MAAVQDSIRPGDSDLAHRLGMAAARGELELHFQPAFDLSTAEIGDMEALIRWAHPERGLLWPADFLPVADQTGQLGSLGQWVLERGAAEAARWPTGHRCWVNASADELADPGYPDRVGAAITAAHLPAFALGIDLPEAALLGLAGGALGLCRALHAAGAALAVDHVSEGRALDAALAGLDVDHIKLGRRLVRGIDADPTRCAQVARVVAVAADLGMTVAAVGVESWPEAAMLVELGVSSGHGFLFSPPQRADRARWMLTRGNAARGSYLHDGGSWLATGGFAADLHDALPGSGAAGTPVASAAFTRKVATAPAPEALPVPAAGPGATSPGSVRITPLHGAGNVHTLTGHDPFGRLGGRRS